MDKVTKKIGTCIQHGESFSRVHGRVDLLEVDMTKVNITLFGDPSRNVEGLLQTNARHWERVSMWMTVCALIGSTLVVALIGVAVKLFTGGH
jgi:hypothetical protein